MTDEPSKKVDESVDEFEERLKEVEEKAERLKSRSSRMPDPPEWNYKRPSWMRKKPNDEGARGLGVGISVAYSMVGCLALGWFIGWLVDHERGNTGGEGQVVGILLGCGLGVASAFWLINRLGGKGD